MAVARFYETTYDRILALFRRKKPMSREEANDYFFGLYPYWGMKIDYGTIGGALNFIYEKLHENRDVGYIDGLTRLDNTEYRYRMAYRIKVESKNAIIETKAYTIKINNYNTQYPTIGVQPKVSNSSYIANIEMIDFRDDIITQIMRSISSLLADAYIGVLIGSRPEIK